LKKGLEPLVQMLKKFSVAQEVFIFVDNKNLLMTTDENTKKYKESS
jgi:hypothetical protein